MTKTAKTTAKAVKAAAPKKTVAQVPAPAVEAEDVAREKARQESAPMTIRLVGAYSYSGGGAPHFNKGGTATLARSAAEKLLRTGLFEEVITE